MSPTLSPEREIDQQDLNKAITQASMTYALRTDLNVDNPHCMICAYLKCPDKNHQFEQCPILTDKAHTQRIVCDLVRIFRRTKKRLLDTNKKAVHNLLTLLPDYDDPDFHLGQE